MSDDLCFDEGFVRLHSRALVKYFAQYYLYTRQLFDESFVFGVITERVPQAVRGR